MPDPATELAEIYDLRTRHIADDLPMILRVVSTYGPGVLELGCGTGRVLRALASAGHVDAAGVDSWNAAIEVARRTLPSVEFAVQTMQEFCLNRTFDVVLIPFNTIELLPSIADVLSTLQRAYAHCRPGGIIFIDTQPATFDPTKLDPHVPMRKLRQIDDPSRGAVDVFFSATRDPVQRSSHCTMLYRWAGAGGDRTMSTDYVVRPLTFDELTLALRMANFELIATRGDYREAEYDPRIHHQLNIVARKPQPSVAT